MDRQGIVCAKIGICAGLGSAVLFIGSVGLGSPWYETATIAGMFLLEACVIFILTFLFGGPPDDKDPPYMGTWHW